MIQQPTPRLQIDLDKLFHNAQSLVNRLHKRGISVTAITKATLGLPEVANTWLRAGVSGLGDSRIENIAKMRAAQVSATMTLIRAPMLSQIDEVVALTNLSLNSELAVIRLLSAAAKKVDCIHEVIFMVELGDLREGMMPEFLESSVREVLGLPNLLFKGIGTNLACRSGVSPDAQNMSQLSRLADATDATFGRIVKVVSGGNSANLDWALSPASIGRINNLRLGEALLLGCEPLHRKPINGLHATAITLVAEVIELKDKPCKPWGTIAQAAFGEAKPTRENEQGQIKQAILAIGMQDVDPDGLTPPQGIQILASSSDHLVVDVSAYKGSIKVGSEVLFQLDYSALLRAMTSPFILKMVISSEKGVICENC